MCGATTINHDEPKAGTAKMRAKEEVRTAYRQYQGGRRFDPVLYVA